jgi:hypothetical protein
MSSALHHAQERGPRTDRLPVLVRHHPGKLVQVAEVVRRPGGEKLGKRHHSERGVAAAPLEIGRLQLQGTKLVQTFGTQAREGIEQFVE